MLRMLWGIARDGDEKESLNGKIIGLLKVEWDWKLMLSKSWKLYLDEIFVKEDIIGVMRGLTRSFNMDWAE